MANLNRTCGICHKKYSYCPSCAADAKKPTWMVVFCCENCKKIYDLINDYRYKLLTKKEAFEKAKLLDLSCTNELPENFKKILNEIIEEECIVTESVMESIKSEKNNVIENDTTEIKVVKNKELKTTEVIEVVEEKEVIRKPKTKKKVKDVE